MDLLELAPRAPLLAALLRGLAGRDARVIQSPKRAAVVLVLREQEGQGPQALFMKRAKNPRDRWSGDVGLPGGRQARGETDLQTAVRECREEIGLDLGDEGRFALVGRLHDLRARRTLVVSTFVFLQTAAVTPELDLCPKEVDETVWVPLELLLRPPRPLDDLQKPLSTLRKLPRWADALPLRLLGVEPVLFPCIWIQPPPAAAHPRAEYVLWGTTLRLLSQLPPLAGERRILPDNRTGLVRLRFFLWTWVMQTFYEPRHMIMRRWLPFLWSLYGLYRMVLRVMDFLAGPEL